LRGEKCFLRRRNKGIVKRVLSLVCSKVEMKKRIWFYPNPQYSVVNRLDGAFNFSSAKAASANCDALRCTVNHYFDFLDVGGPGPFGFNVTVTYFVATLAFFVAYLTFGFQLLHLPEKRLF